MDYDRRLAVVALDRDGEGAGVARYEGSPGAEAAEVALAVAPGWRWVGLARALLGALAEAAVARGIRRFTATSLAENAAVAALFRGTGWPRRVAVSAGVAETELDLPAPSQRP